jgi:hypothetical protein
MRYLVDTKVFLWMLAEPDKFGPRAAEVLTHECSEVYLSAVSHGRSHSTSDSAESYSPSNPAGMCPDEWQRPRYCACRSIRAMPTASQNSMITASTRWTGCL